MLLKQKMPLDEEEEEQDESENKQELLLDFQQY